MKKLFQKRLVNHIIEMTKYLRYVLNDFFIFAMIFFLGGLGLGYSNWLKTLNTSEWWSRPLVIVILLVILQIGGLASLFQSADRVFLLPREVDLRKYLKAALRYSLAMAFLPQLLVWFILLPLLKTTMAISNLNLILLLVVLLLLKSETLLFRYFRGFQLKPSRAHRFTMIEELGLSFLALTLGFYQILPWLSIILILVIIGIVDLFTFNHLRKGPLNWNHLITTEERRMHRIYQFFNMFTDVPQLSGRVKKRKYLNPLLQALTNQTTNPYLYLYLHGILRDTETSGLYLRLTAIGIFLMVFIDGFWLPIIIGLLFIYLIGFQLIPFYYHFDDNVFTKIYPLNAKLQIKSFQRMMWSLLIITTLLFTIAVAIGTTSVTTAGLLLILALVEDSWLIQIYLPTKIKKARKFLE